MNANMPKKRKKIMSTIKEELKLDESDSECDNEPENIKAYIMVCTR